MAVPRPDHPHEQEHDMRLEYQVDVPSDRHVATVPGTAVAANPYHYAGNDPVNACDPFRLRPVTDDVVTRGLDGVGDWLGNNWEYLAGGVLVVAGIALTALYDDCQVLPDPQKAVGAVLLPGETARLRHLHKALNPLLEDLGDSSDSVYLADPQWPSVVHTARAALDGMRSPPTGATP